MSFTYARVFIAKYNGLQGKLDMLSKAYHLYNEKIMKPSRTSKAQNNSGLSPIIPYYSLLFLSPIIPIG